MGQKWATKRKTLKDKMEDDPAKVIYGIICAILVVAAIVYAAVTGTAPDNNGF